MADPRVAIFRSWGMAHGAADAGDVLDHARADLDQALADGYELSRGKGRRR
jgi:hypothetical protein